MDEPKAPDEFEQQKLQFAALFLRVQLEARTQAELDNAAFKAASMVFPDAPGRAVWAEQRWTADPIVRAEMARINRDGGDGSELPGKSELARQAWAMLKDPFVSPKDRISAMRLYGELQGLITAKGDGSEGGESTHMPPAPTYTIV